MSEKAMNMSFMGMMSAVLAAMNGREAGARFGGGELVKVAVRVPHGTAPR